MEVKLAGYTGQRDAWEEYSSEAVVELQQSGEVTLKLRGSEKRQISLSYRDLERAICVLREAGQYS